MEAARVFHYWYISVGCVPPAHCRESRANFTSVRRHFATCNHNNAAGSSQNLLCQETEEERLRTTRFPLGPWFSRCCYREPKESKSNLCPSDTLFLSSFGLGLFHRKTENYWVPGQERSPHSGVSLKHFQWEARIPAQSTFAMKAANIEEVFSNQNVNIAISQF